MLIEYGEVNMGGFIKKLPDGGLAEDTYAFMEHVLDEDVNKEKMVSLDKVVDEFRQFIVDYFPNLFRTGEEVKEVMDLFRKRLEK